MINLIKNPQLSEDLSFCSAAVYEALSLAWKRTAAAADERLAAALPSVWVTFTTESEMRRLNAEQRALDEVTDVLSFPMLNLRDGHLESPLSPGDCYPNEDGRMTFELGDIVICVPRAFEQAAEFGHSPLRELTFLALHGMLHLCGYDHTEDEQAAARMEGEQEAVLNELGITREADAYEGAGPRTIYIEDAGVEEEEEEEQPVGPFHSGFVSVVGRPNAGKSTLLNYLSGAKLAIVSPKSQTTRRPVRSVVNRPGAQLIFIDTPGMHKPTHQLGRRMMQDTWISFFDSDVVLLVVDALKGNFTSMEASVIKKAAETGLPVVVALNKTDDMVKENLLPIIQRYSETYDFAAIVPISALTGDGVDVLTDELVRLLPEGPRYYPETAFTDQSERALAEELIREQILRYTHDEIPHGTAVLIDRFDETFRTGEDGEPISEYDREIVRIYATIYCDREGHKGILIGKNGEALKRIGTAARHSLEGMLGCRVYLELFVKVRKDWRNNPAILARLGYDPIK